jgi:predicted permease
VETLIQDIRYALRSLRKSPGFALAAVLTIGLAIGANTTVFTWLRTMTQQPVPAVPESDRLMSLSVAAPGGRIWQVSYADYRDWREGARAFEGIAAERFTQLNLRTDGPSQRVWGALASGNYFDVLRVRPLLGRTLRPTDETEAAPVAVISHGLWQRVFSGDSGVVGRSVTLNGHGFTVVGVMPPRFAGSTWGYSYDVWIPLTLVDLTTPARSPLLSRGWRFIEPVVARLRPGVSVEQARADINAVHRPLAATYAEDRGTTVRLGRMADEGSSAWFGPVMGALLGVTALLLLVACANIANLLLARATARRREVAIRLAVGAGRLRLVRQLLTESMLLALAGGALGILIALWGKEALMASVPPMPFPLAVEFSLDPGILCFALLATLATGAAAGLAPALKATRGDLVSDLRDGAASAAPRRSSLQSSLVTAQVALSLVSLVCAGLFLRGLLRARDVDMGYREPGRLLLAETDLFMAGYTDSTGPVALDRLLERVRAVPGVRSATTATMGLQGFGTWGTASAEIEGYSFQPDENRAVEFNRVGPDYFQTVGTPVLRGRGIGLDDRAGNLPAIVVNESFVRRFWPGQDPLGRRIRLGETWRTVVGVSRDAAYRPDNRPPPPIFFVPILQSYRSASTVHVRAAGDPLLMQQALRRAFEVVNADLPFTDVRTGVQQVGVVLFAQRLGAGALALLGLLALGLSALGIYGVLSYSVSQRTREIGIRVAIGASKRDVIAMVVGGAARLSAVGLALGLVLAVGAGRLLRSQIFGVSPLDPVTFVGVVVLLAAVALLAAWLPARRAARVDPIIALQAE